MNTNILHAVSDVTRLKIMKALHGNELSACSLPATAGVSQPAVSQHLSVLLDAKLVKMRRDGSKHFYKLTSKGEKVLGDVLKW